MRFEKTTVAALAAGLFVTGAAMDHPAHAAAVPMGQGAGIGRMAGLHEQGNFCCLGDYPEGAFDQRSVEARQDVLVYTTEPLSEPLDVAGPVTVTLYVSSDARDTDFTAKLLDVYPDGRALNLDDTILRARYRDGFDKQVWMSGGEIYEIELGPMATANVFGTGHRVRLEISSSNFPRYDRNLNTGGRNYDEATGVVAHNIVHHTAEHSSRLVLSVLDR